MNPVTDSTATLTSSADPSGLDTSPQFHSDHSLSEHEHDTAESPSFKSRTLERVSKAFAPYVPIVRRRSREKRPRRERTSSQSTVSSGDEGRLRIASEAAEPTSARTGHGVKDVFRKLSVVTRRSRNASLESINLSNDAAPNKSSHEDSDQETSHNTLLIPIISFSAKRNRELHRLFPSLPDSETHIDDYSCALQKEILIHGRLYLTERHLCFSANIFGYVTELVLNVEDVVGVEKKSVLIIPNAVSVTLKDGKQYFFASFVKRDEAYLKMLTLLHAAKYPPVLSHSPSARDSLSSSSSWLETPTPQTSTNIDTKTDDRAGPHQTIPFYMIAIPILSLFLTLSATLVLWRVRHLVIGVELLEEVVFERIGVV